MSNRTSQPQPQSSGIRYGLIIITALVILLSGLLSGAGLGMLVDRFLPKASLPPQPTSLSRLSDTAQITASGETLTPSSTFNPATSPTEASATETLPFQTSTTEPSATFPPGQTASPTVFTLTPTNPPSTAEASPSPQPVTGVDTNTPERCNHKTYLNGLLYAFTQREVPLFKDPVYALEDEAEQIGTLKKGIRVELVMEQAQSTYSLSPRCTRSSYFWLIRTESGQLVWAFEYYYRNKNKEKEPLFTEGYYLAPNPP